MEKGIFFSKMAVSMLATSWMVQLLDTDLTIRMIC